MVSTNFQLHSFSLLKLLSFIVLCLMVLFYVSCGVLVYGKRVEILFNSPTH